MIGRIYNTGRCVEVAVKDGRIAAIADVEDRADLPWLVPSFFDIQINGALGIGFTADSLTLEEIRQVEEALSRHGIGGFAPTVITASFETIQRSFAALSNAVESDPELNRRMPAFHLEGPYISPDDGARGAHPLQHVCEPDWDEFRCWQDTASGRIKLVTLAPERPGALAFIEKLNAAGVVVALGHTAASSQQIRDAAKAGAKLSTHLGNGSHAVLPRHDNYLWEQLACDDLWASVIADGQHLPAALLKTIVRAKTPSRLILTCDASPLAGLPPGRYSHWGQELEVEASGRIGVPGTPFLAGSASFTDFCVEHIEKVTGVSLIEAVEMASVNPRRLLGLPQARLEVGAPWDFRFMPVPLLQSKSERV
jgi:N-acetylglucosamine-6-phosphate deacetylase